MTVNELVASLLALGQLLLSWPTVFLVLVLIFRKQITHLLASLGARLTRAEILGTTLEFAKSEAFQDAVVKGAEAYEREPESLFGFIQNQVEKVMHSDPTGLSDGPTLRGRNLLWVSSDIINSTYEVSLLRGLGANVLVAGSPEQALTLAQRPGIELIIADVRDVRDEKEPSGSGHQFLQKYDFRMHVGPGVIIYTNPASMYRDSRFEAPVWRAESTQELLTAILEVFLV